MAALPSPGILSSWERGAEITSQWSLNTPALTGSSAGRGAGSGTARPAHALGQKSNFSVKARRGGHPPPAGLCQGPARAEPGTEPPALPAPTCGTGRAPVAAPVHRLRCSAGGRSLPLPRCPCGAGGRSFPFPGACAVPVRCRRPLVPFPAVSVRCRRPLALLPPGAVRRRRPAVPVLPLPSAAVRPCPAAAVPPPLSVRARCRPRAK